jgi:hypothetical protein
MFRYASKDNGTKPVIHDYHAGNNQRWTLDDKARLVNVFTGKCLDDVVCRAYKPYPEPINKHKHLLYPFIDTGQ